MADFDAATIATTHEFCLAMLDGLGVLGDREPQARFVEQLADLTREVATDEYLRRYAASGTPTISLEEALDIARHAVEAVHAGLVPARSSSDDQSAAAERVSYAGAVRAEVERRKRSGRLFTYDDMLTRLRDALRDPQRGEAAALRLRRRYRIVMVDEFQDTDPIQWEILRRAFHGHSTLILIGDPKQSIYAFRGADVFSYLDAVGHADRVCTLATNWRSDQALVDAIGSLMGGAALGDERIVVRQVNAQHQQRRLHSGGPPGQAAPVRIRVFPHALDADQLPTVGRLRPRVLEDLVADITEVLASDTLLDTAAGPRRLRPADLAVLVRRNERGETIRDRLVAAGVPAVMIGAGSVFASAAAQEWLTLLVALDQPRQQTVRQAALTCFVGWTFADLAEAGEDALIQLSQQIRWWSKVLAGRGVAALLEVATADTHWPEQVLGGAGGERMMTDVRHLGQSLHAAMTLRQLGTGALVEWLRERIEEARGSSAAEGSRRLETDAEAVTVLTVHRSKGLEFPVVYLPEAWDRHVESRDEGRLLRLHEATPAGPGGFVLDVGGRNGPGRTERFARYRAEESGEDLRLLYVALTRAQSQVVTWWAPSHNTPSSGLHRLISRPVGHAGLPEGSYPLTGDPLRGRDLGAGVSLERVEPRAVRPRPPEPVDLGPLSVRRFARTLDLDWRRTSYSALTAAAHGALDPPAGVASEPDLHREDDEPPDPREDPAPAAAPSPTVARSEPAGPAEPVGLQRPSPMGELPSGAEFGSAVHLVFETVDPREEGLSARLREACAAALARGSAGRLRPDVLAEGLLPVFTTPLGPLAGERRLCDIAPVDRLAELTFEYPLGAAPATRGERLSAIGPLLDRHLPPDDPLAAYSALLADPVLAEQSLRGFLNGSIDAVLRVVDDGTPRYLVVDYKTNWLGGFDGEPLTLGHYAPPRMAAAMMASHYPLQALLYAVALHRLLRWRQPGYAPQTHLGGVLYLFVRGMAGADTPRVAGVPCGVFSWQPPAQLVVELSDLLDGARPRPGDRLAEGDGL